MPAPGRLGCSIVAVSREGASVVKSRECSHIGESRWKRAACVARGSWSLADNWRRADGGVARGGRIIYHGVMLKVELESGGRFHSMLRVEAYSSRKVRDTWFRLGTSGLKET